MSNEFSKEQTETVSVGSISISEIATFSQLIKLAEESEAQSKSTARDLEDGCKDRYGAQNYKRLLQDPVAWKSTFVGLFQDW